MPEIAELLRISKETADRASRRLSDGRNLLWREFRYSVDNPREIKAVADQVMEEIILSALAGTGLPLLSEEKGELPGETASGLRFIIDPLDGTVNYVRDLGGSSVSIALYKDNEPLFGVLGLYPSGQLAWGGKEFGAFLDDTPLNVSTIAQAEQAVLCTGFPSRFDVSEPEAIKSFIKRVQRFQKVRMIGAASISLLKVASGSAEMYAENEIMLWDVAAGLALVEGAGGKVETNPGKNRYALDVTASNGCIRM